jgi:hypothetical protein
MGFILAESIGVGNDTLIEEMREVGFTGRRASGALRQENLVEVFARLGGLCAAAGEALVDLSVENPPSA